MVAMRQVIFFTIVLTVYGIFITKADGKHMERDVFLKPTEGSLNVLQYGKFENFHSKVKREAKRVAKNKKKNNVKSTKKNKNKDTKRNNVNKKKRNGNPRQDSSSSSCQDLDCLIDLAQTLKVEKGTVRNFLAQVKRIRSKMALMLNKEAKSGDRWETAKYLEKRLGETKDHTGLDSNGPLCKGVYNSSTGIAASDLAHNLEKCNTTIQEACGRHVNVETTTLASINNCQNVIIEYKIKAQSCQNSPTNCPCWKDLNSKVSAVLACNKGPGSANDVEKLLNGDYKQCKNVFISCSKYEDEAIKYMVQCYTSETQIKSNIKELLVIKDAATKLKTNQEAIVSSSEKQKNGKGDRKHLQEKRQAKTETVDCATYITAVEKVDQLFNQTNLIGSQSTIVTQSTNIIKQTVQVCNATQITVLNANIGVLVKVITHINVIIVQYQKVLKTLTKTTLSLDSLNIVTVTLQWTVPTTPIVSNQASTQISTKYSSRKKQILFQQNMRRKFDKLDTVNNRKKF